MKKFIIFIVITQLVYASIRDIITNKPVVRKHLHIKNQYSKNSLIVKYKKGFDIFSLSLPGIKKIHSFKHLNKHLSYSYAVVKLKKTADLESVKRTLLSNPNILGIEYNYEFKPESTTPNDPYFDKQWFLKSSIENKDINVTDVWDDNTGSEDVVVAVLDTGVGIEHEDLKDNIYVNEDELNGEDGVDDDNNGYVDDVRGYDFAVNMDGDNGPLIEAEGSHGTHVAGIIGAVGNNDVGVSGVNWKVKILPVKIARPNGLMYSNDILEGINYIIAMKDKGVNIVAANASYGGYYPNYNVFGSSSTKDAIKALGDRGIVFFSSAGNTNRDNDAIYYDYTKLPASYNLDNIVSVAALSSAADKEKGSYSNYGLKTVNLAAPGSDIYSTVNYISGNDINDEIFYESFETNDSNWTKSTGSSWGVTDAEAYNGNYSVTDSPDGNYSDTLDVNITSMEFNLSGYKSQHIAFDFCMKRALVGSDRLEVHFYDGNSWYRQSYYYYNTDGWVCVGIPIQEAFKVDNFKVTFLLNVNGDGQTSDGVYLDSIKIGTYSALNSYEYMTGTSMASPVGAGSYALLTSIFENENMYQRLSRELGNGLKPTTFEISGVKVNVAMAVNGAVKPFIFNTKEVNSFSGDEFNLSVANADNPEVYVGDVKARIISNNNGNLTIDLPKDPQREIRVYNNSLKSVNTLYISKWHIHLRMPSMHYDGNDVVYYDGKIYVHGGDDYFGKNSSIMDVYSIDNNSWSSKSASNDFIFATAKAYNGKIYYVGGSDSNGNYLSNVQIYDIDNDSWDDGASLPENIKFARSVAFDENMYVFGGYTDITKSSVYKYNMQSDSFEKMADMNVSRELPAVCKFKGKVYIFGGYNTEVLKSAEVYDVDNNTTKPVSPMPVALYAINCVNVNDNFIVIFGGLDENDTYSPKIIRYYPDEDRYELFNSSSMQTIVNRYSLENKVVKSDNGVLYFMGGRVKDSAVKATSSFEDINISEFVPIEDPVESVSTKTTTSITSSDTSSVDDNTTEVSSNVSGTQNSSKSLGSFDFVMFIILLGGVLLVRKRFWE